MLLRLTSRVRSQSSSVISRMPPGISMPTLLCRMSIRPSSRMHSRAMRSQSDPTLTSARNVKHDPPSPSMRRRVSSAASRFRSTTMTRAPSRANSTAAALPLPTPGPIDPPPVTIAVLSCSRFPIRVTPWFTCLVPRPAAPPPPALVSNPGPDRLAALPTRALPARVMACAPSAIAPKVSLVRVPRAPDLDRAV